MFTFEAHILKRIRFCSERHKAMLSEVPSFFLVQFTVVTKMLLTLKVFFKFLFNIFLSGKATCYFPILLE